MSFTIEQSPPKEVGDVNFIVRDERWGTRTRGEEGNET